MTGNLNGGSRKRALNETFEELPTTVFTVMTNLAIEHGSVNLGQGFPDDEGPAAMKALVGKATTGGPNQYTNLQGIPEARQAVARHSEHYTGIALDWKTQTLLTNGATEALAAAFLAFVNPGDEVILLDPTYDAYAPMAKRAGAKVVAVPLNDNDWSVPRDALEAAFSEKTKLILINTPHNPTGKVFTKGDLEFIAGLLEKYDSYAILDEVYQHLVFKGHQHTTLQNLPGMMQRSIRVGSAGKTFSLTGWKIGWVTGPPDLINAVAKAHQFLVFCLNGPLQKAVAHGLDNERNFIEGLADSLEAKCEYLRSNLERLGFKIMPVEGTYFLTADFRPLLRDGQNETDVDFAIRLTKEAGVTAIPVSAFYNGEKKPHHLIRFCFCKDDAKLEKAIALLEKYFQGKEPVQ